MFNALPVTVIPVDVYGLIIDSLAEDDEELTTMRACSLVSRGFLPLARKHIFASIEINNHKVRENRPSPRRATVDAFVRLIRRNHEIGEYIRKIDYCIAGNDHILYPIPRTLRKLTKLRSLSIGHYYAGKKLKWRTQSWTLRSALLHLMQLPTLSYLKLHWIENFPVSDLIHSSSLKHLEIQDTDFAEENIVRLSTTPLPRKSIHLHEYTAGLRSASATKKLSKAKRPDGLPIVNFTELAKVTADCHIEGDINAIRSILIQTKQLQNIDLTISEFLTFTGLADMVTPSIRTLKGMKLASMINGSNEDPLCGLCYELEEISATGCSIIESISIHISIAAFADCRRGEEWGLLETVLTKKNAWPELQQVSLKIQVYKYGQIDDDNLVDALNELPESQFKKLSASETLNFSFEVTKEDIGRMLWQ